MYIIHDNMNGLFIFQHSYKVMGSNIRTDVTMTARIETPREEVHIANLPLYVSYR